MDSREEAYRKSVRINTIYTICLDAAAMSITRMQMPPARREPTGLDYRAG